MLIRKVLKNAGVLLSGRGVSAISSILAVALVARSLGAKSYGLLTVIQTCGFVVETVISFNAWQAFIKYGAGLNVDLDSDRIKKLIKYLLAIELFAAIMGAAIAVMIMPIIANMYGWDNELKNIASIYMLYLISAATGTCIGVLRMHDKYGFLSIQSIASSAIKLILIVVAYALGFGVKGFLYVQGVGVVIGNLLLMMMAAYQINKSGLGGFYKVSLKGVTKEFCGINKFLFYSNTNGSIKIISRYLDTFIVGAALNNSSVAYLKIARQIGGLPMQVTSSIYEVIYADLSKLWVKKEYDEFYKLILVISMVLGAMVLLVIVIFCFIGQRLVVGVYGGGYGEVVSISILFLIGTMIASLTIAVPPAIMAMGEISVSFKALIIASVIYLVVLVFAVPKYGYLAAGWSNILYYILWSYVIIGPLVKKYKHLKA